MRHSIKGNIALFRKLVDNVFRQTLFYSFTVNVIKVFKLYDSKDELFKNVSIKNIKKKFNNLIELLNDSLEIEIIFLLSR